MNEIITPYQSAPGTVVPSGVQVCPAGQAGPASSTDLPTIWSVRQRSYNSFAFCNGNFEIDQRKCGQANTFPAGANNWMLGPDRVGIQNQMTVTGTSALTSQQIAANVVIPGTSQYITSKIWRITLTAQHTAAIPAGGNISAWWFIEGPQLRELLGDVHTIQVLCRSSVASLKFGVGLNDNQNPATTVLGKLCTLGVTPNTWNLISLPNIPAFPANKFDVLPGSGFGSGYWFTLALAGAANITLAANDVWTSSTTLWIPSGIDNFASKPVGSTFDIAFIQHEPGPTASGLMDLSWLDNYDRCLRYYQKSWNLAEVPGTTNANGCVNALTPATGWNPLVYVPFPKPMFMVPQINLYSPNTGAANMVRDQSAAVDRALAASPSGIFANQKGYQGCTLTAPNAAATWYTWHHIAETGY